MTEPFLCNLGVSERDQLLGPTKQNMPSKFNSANAQAIQIWNQVVDSVATHEDALINWGNCIRDYVSRCISYSIFPYLTDIPDTFIVETAIIKISKSSIKKKKI